MKAKPILILLITCSWIFAQTHTASEYYEIALKAYKEKDYESFVQNLHKAIDAGTKHPRVIYNLACGYALLNNRPEAIRWLNYIADLGISYRVDQDSDFDSIRKTSEFQSAVARFKKNSEPITKSTSGFTIRDTEFIPEGLAFDSKSRQFYLGGILKQKIVEIDRTGKVHDFSRSADGLWSVLGMSVDPERRMLWVSSSTLEGIGNSGKKTIGGIFRYDLQSRKHAKKYLLPDDQPHQLGDVIVNASGDAFTTDSLNPAVYWIDHRTDRLEQLAVGDLFRSPQGLCFSKDERILFVADYVRGIFGIVLETKKSWIIDTPQNVTLAGIDGLYRYGDRFIATQNGFTPNRILRIQLSPDKKRTESVEVLEASDPARGEITLGTIAGEEFYFIANSQLGFYLKDKKAQLVPAAIRKLKP